MPSWSQNLDLFTSKPAGITQALKKYSNNLELKGFPVIFDFNHLSLLLGVRKKTLSAIINSSERFYRVFYVKKKRSNGVREISAPYPILYDIQNWIRQNILIKIDVSEFCYAYKKNASIVKNASLHLHKNHLYKLDLSDFFGTITQSKVTKIFIDCGYSYQVSFFLSQLCLLQNKLPQGACTSPVISNIVTETLDRRIARLCESDLLTYSRYADDITISGNVISLDFINELKVIIGNEGFVVNELKEILIKGNKRKKIITGISITNNVLKLPREKKRLIKQQVFLFLKYDHKVDPDTDDFDPYFPERLIGKLNYWKQIEPQCPQASSFLEKVTAKNNQLIVRYSKIENQSCKQPRSLISIVRDFYKLVLHFIRLLFKGGK